MSFRQVAGRTAFGIVAVGFALWGGEHLLDAADHEMLIFVAVGVGPTACFRFQHAMIEDADLALHAVGV